MKRLQLILLMTLLLVGVSLPAHAAKTNLGQGAITVETHVGYHTFQAFEPLNWWEFGAQGSYFIIPNWSLDLNIGWLGYDVVAYTYGASVGYHFLLTDDTQAYLRLGVTKDTIKKPPTLGSFGTTYAFGLRFLKFDHLAPRIELMGISKKNSQEYLLSFGLEFQVAESQSDAEKAIATKPTPSAKVLMPQVATMDMDNDGILESQDHCPNTLANADVDEKGCLKSIELPIRFSGEMIAKAKSKEFYAFYEKDFAELKKVALHLKKYPKLAVTFQAFAGPGQHVLAKKRAESVKDYFTAKFGISPERIRTSGRISVKKDGYIRMLVRNPDAYLEMVSLMATPVAMSTPEMPTPSAAQYHCTESLVGSTVDENGCTKSIDLTVLFAGKTLPKYSSKAYFDFYRKDYAQLRQIALHMRKYPKLILSIQAFAGPDQDLLAKKRAISIQQYFFFKFGLSPKRFDTLALISKTKDGQTQMIVKNPKAYSQPTLPKTPTPSATKDSDGDGITDLQDSCTKTLAGSTVDNTGCLKSITLSVRLTDDTIPKYSSKAFFDLFRKDYKNLRQVALHLKRHPRLSVSFQGYASQGKKALAKKRAEAVMYYMNRKFGIASHRMSSTARINDKNDGKIRMIANNPSVYPPKKTP